MWLGWLALRTTPLAAFSVVNESNLSSTCSTSYYQKPCPHTVPDLPVIYRRSCFHYTFHHLIIYLYQLDDRFYLRLQVTPWWRLLIRTSQTRVGILVRSRSCSSSPSFAPRSSLPIGPQCMRWYECWSPSWNPSLHQWPCKTQPRAMLTSTWTWAAATP